MAYIGVQPQDTFLSIDKQTFTTSATATYTLDNTVSSVNDIALFLNNVRQEPTTAYTISGTTLTLASAITSSDSMYCIYLGKSIGTKAPATGSVTNAMLTNSSVTVNGTSISLGASGSVAPSDGSITMAKLSTSATEADNVKQRVCKVWVNFNGTGTVAIRDDFNVSSITDSSTGEYLVNFSTALANNDNAMFVSAGKASGAPSSSNSSIAFLAEDSSQTTNRIDMKVTDSTGSTVDRDLVTAIAFGESA